MVRSFGKQQILTGIAMTDEEKEIFLKKKRYRTKEEEKEFIRIWKVKYGIPGHAIRFYSMCNHHRKFKKTRKH